MHVSAARPVHEVGDLRFGEVRPLIDAVGHNQEPDAHQQRDAEDHPRGDRLLRRVRLAGDGKEAEGQEEAHRPHGGVDVARQDVLVELLADHQRLAGVDVDAALGADLGGGGILLAARRARLARRFGHRRRGRRGGGRLGHLVCELVLADPHQVARHQLVLGHPLAVDEQAVGALEVDDLPAAGAEVHPLQLAVVAGDHLAREREVLVGQLADLDVGHTAQVQLLADAGGPVADDKACVEIAGARALGQLLAAQERDGA